MESDPVRGKTIRWKYNDGPMAGKSFEHTFGADGVVAWSEVDGRKDTTKSSTNGRPKTDERRAQTKAKYEVAPINEDVYAVSYLSASGFTLTSVLDFSAGNLVSFASNEKQLVLQRGTFEVEERVS
jgi:hypothetical protein